MSEKIYFYLAAPVADISPKMKQDILNVKNMCLIMCSNEKIAFEDLRIYDPKNLQIPNAWNIPPNEWARSVFTIDVCEIDQCDWMIVCDYGRKGTAGTSWEVGYAFAKYKNILIVKMPEVKEQSLMITCSSTYQIDYDDFMRNGFDFTQQYNRYKNNTNSYDLK